MGWARARLGLGLGARPKARVRARVRTGAKKGGPNILGVQILRDRPIKIPIRRRFWLRFCEVFIWDTVSYANFFLCTVI